MALEQQQATEKKENMCHVIIIILILVEIYIYISTEKWR